MTGPNLDAENVQHGEGFKPELVPQGPAADWFYSGKPGDNGERVGLSNDEYDETKARMLEYGTPEDLPWAHPKEES